MELTQFEELERKVLSLLEHHDKLLQENSQLHSRLSALESQLRNLSTEHERISVQRDELLGHQRDQEKEELIRHKVVDLLQKLENL